MTLNYNGMTLNYFGMTANYCNILTLEKVGFKITVVIYPGIFITLALGNLVNEE
jgi:hypothetical protein